jgi:predicted dehydrogenase
LYDNLLGDIYSVRCEVGKYLPTWRPDRDYREGVSARKDLGGGVLLELSHEIDYLHWLFGDVDWVHSTATNQSKLKIDVEDSVHSILGFKTNVRNQQLVGILSLDFIRHDETRVCTVIGEKGTLVWDGVKGEVRCYLESEGKWVILFQQEPKKDETYFAEWKNFLDSMTRGVEPLVTGTQGLKVLETIEAIRNSAALGRRIDVVAGRSNGENFA